MRDDCIFVVLLSFTLLASVSFFHGFYLMMEYTRRFLATLLLVATTAIMLTGCFSSQPTRGSLSGAMSKASDNNTGSREVAPPPPSERTHVEPITVHRHEHYHRHRFIDDPPRTDTTLVVMDTEVVYDTVYVSDSTAQPHQDTTHIASANIVQPSTAEHELFAPPSPKGWFELSGGSGLLDQQTYYGLSSGKLAIAVDVQDRVRFGLELWGGWSPIQKTDTLSRSIDGVTLLGAALRLDWYATPPYTFLGLYFFAGAGVDFMLWSYKNPIISQGSSISSDALSGLDLFVGAGINIVQTKNFQLGFEVRPGFAVWIGQTSEGFDNNVFDPLLYVKFGPELNISF